MGNLPIVKDFMATKLYTLSPTTDIFQAIKYLLEHQISGAPVVDSKHNMIGIISEKDCLHLLTKGPKNKKLEINVEDFMTKKVETIQNDMDLYSAAEIFVKKSYRRYPVLNKNGKLVGQISRRDILRAIKENLKSSTFKITTKVKPVPIMREEVSTLKFPREEVLNSPEHRKIRTVKLENATRLGNIEQYKVKIVFEDAEGMKMVYTTVWHSTEKYVSLKGGINIPVHRVHEVNLF